jgi:hypothetical protein
MHGLKHLCLHIQHFLKSRRRGGRRVGVLVVILPIVFIVVGGDMIPCVGRLKYEY